jgi:multicomponent Na+:H+ antiporter subunit D
MTTIANLPPGWVMIVGALLLPVFAARLQARCVLGLSLASLLLFLLTPSGRYGNLDVFGAELNLVRMDEYSWPFGIVFHLAAIVWAIYALHVQDTRQHVSGLLYGGAAIGAVCAGDLLSLFVFWELTAISSVFLIWAADSQRAFKSGMRYLIIQVTSGVLLLSGAIVQFAETGSLEFSSFVGEDGGLGMAGRLVLFAFGIKCAFPLLHNWLQDSYPNATVTGTVLLSALTTKLAVYSLVRGFAGFEPLIWVGCTMTLFPIVFAVIENDLRRVLSYSLNNQLGFMVVGIGIGTDLAINGTVAHAFCHIIYKSLLFMSMGAVLYRVGTTKATELGGLHKSMPWTTTFCLIGAGAISGFPLLSGFVSKSMILAAAAEQQLLVVGILLLIASAGVMEHSGIKIPYFAFFAHDSGKRPQEAPKNMLIAMGIAATGCIVLGTAYPLLYALLPKEVDYQPYTFTHVITQLQLLMFASLAFVFLIKTRLYPEEKRATVLDTDWVYRKALPQAITMARDAVAKIDGSVRSGFLRGLSQTLTKVDEGFNEKGLLGGTWSTKTMTFWASILLAASLLVYYI